MSLPANAGTERAPAAIACHSFTTDERPLGDEPGGLIFLMP